MTRTIALTGATGFVGAACLDHMLKSDTRVKALVRNSRKLRDNSGLRDNGGRAELVEGDLGNEAALERLVDGAEAVVHCAGLTHARRDADYRSVNVDGAANIARAAAGAGARLVHISSLSAREPALSAYAGSKRESEDAVANAVGDAVALRLPAIYGPGDMATLPYFKLIKAGFALEPATKSPARASIMHVADAARAIATAVEAPPRPGVYEVEDDAPMGRSWTEIGAALGAVLGKRPRILRAPRALVAAWHGIDIAAARARGRAPGVRTGQVNEFFHVDWVAREPLFGAATGWRAQTPLEEGFAKTALWYQKNGYL